MHRIWQFIKEKLRLTSWQAVVHLVVVEIILNLLWNWLSRMFRVEFFREIGFLIIFVAAIFAVAWYLPKLAPALYSLGTVRTIKQPKPTRLMHDNVLWEERIGATGNLYAGGPLCPKDFTPLARKYGDLVETEPLEDAVISASNSKLYYIECLTEYTLGQKSKRIRASRDEAGNRLEGARRRDREAQET